MNEEEIRKRLLSERPSVKAMMDQRMEEFFDGPSQETFSGVCGALITAVTYGMCCLVPVEVKGSDPLYYMIQSAEGGYAYVFCNSEAELMKCPPAATVVMELKALLKHILEDRSPEVSGLVIDPFYSNKILLHLDRRNISFILDNAESLIDSQDSLTRKVLREGLSGK